jgi:hypothetical protein
MTTGRRIATVTGDGAGHMDGFGLAASRGVGLRITMADGFITMVHGAGLRTIVTTMDTVGGIRH